MKRHKLRVQPMHEYCKSCGAEDSFEPTPKVCPECSRPDTVYDCNQCGFEKSRHRAIDKEVCDRCEATYLVSMLTSTQREAIKTSQEEYGRLAINIAEMVDCSVFVGGWMVRIINEETQSSDFL